MSTVATLIAELKVKLGDRARDELDRLVASPEGQALLERDEAVLIAERAALVKRLAACPGKFKQAQAAAGRRAEAAALAVAAAQKQLVDARDGVVAAGAASLAASAGEADEKLELERELLEGADSRLETFAQHAEDLCGMARHLLVAQPVAKRNWISGERWTEVLTNAVEVDAARNALMQAALTSRGMRLQALDSRSIVEWLQATLSDLEPLLRPFRLDLLSLDENGVLQRDKTMPRRLTINSAIRAAGGSPDVSDDLPGIDPKPNVTRARQMLALLG